MVPLRRDLKRLGEKRLLVLPDFHLVFSRRKTCGRSFQNEIVNRLHRCRMARRNDVVLHVGPTDVYRDPADFERLRRQTRLFFPAKMQFLDRSWKWRRDLTAWNSSDQLVPCERLALGNDFQQLRHGWVAWRQRGIEVIRQFDKTQISALSAFQNQDDPVACRLLTAKGACVKV